MFPKNYDFYFNVLKKELGIKFTDNEVKLYYIFKLTNDLSFKYFSKNDILNYCIYTNRFDKNELITIRKLLKSVEYPIDEDFSLDEELIQ